VNIFFSLTNDRHVLIFRSNSLLPFDGSFTTLLCSIFSRKLFGRCKNMIPKIVWQTYRTHTIPNASRSNVNRMKAQNIDWDFRLYNDSEILQCFRQFDGRVEHVVRQIVPGVARADLWRYCILYLNGGVYLDLDAKLTRRLDWLPLNGAALSLEDWKGGWPQAWRSSFQAMVPLVHHIEPKNFHTLKGQQVRYTSKARRLGYSKCPFGQFMLASSPRHVVFKEMIYDSIKKITSWRETPYTQSIPMVSRICWLTGPSAFTVTVERLIYENKVKVVGANTSHSLQNDSLVVFQHDFDKFVTRKYLANYGWDKNYRHVSGPFMSSNA